MGTCTDKRKRKGRSGRATGGRSASALTVAKPVAPEDLRGGDFVALLECTYEVPTFFWCGVDASLLPPDEPVRLRIMPPEAGVPLRVESVCLPFVLVKHPAGRSRSLDLRRCRVARLDPRYARRAWRGYRVAKKKRRKSPK